MHSFVKVLFLSTTLALTACTDNSQVFHLPLPGHRNRPRQIPQDIIKSETPIRSRDYGIIRKKIITIKKSVFRPGTGRIFITASLQTGNCMICMD